MFKEPASGACHFPTGSQVASKAEKVLKSVPQPILVVSKSVRDNRD